jgi:hypothetical protein
MEYQNSSKESRNIDGVTIQTRARTITAGKMFERWNIEMALINPKLSSDCGLIEGASAVH